MHEHPAPDRALRIVAVALVAAAALGAAGWAGASALRVAPAAASDGHRLRVTYEVRREPAYVPPAPTEQSRLDTLDTASATAIDEGVLSAQAGQALRDLQAQDEARNAAALSAVRAQDSLIARQAALTPTPPDAAPPRPSDGPN